PFAPPRLAKPRRGLPSGRPFRGSCPRGEWSADASRSVVFPPGRRSWRGLAGLPWEAPLAGAGQSEPPFVCTEMSTCLERITQKPRANVRERRTAPKGGLFGNSGLG